MQQIVLTNQDSLNEESKIMLFLIRPLARTIDICIAMILLIILSSFLEPYQRHSLQPFLSLFFWVFIEAFLLSTWGTTPGKWFFNIEVRDKEQKKLKFQQALKRSFKVWSMGLGLGLSVICLPLFAILISYVHLIRKNVFPWDYKSDYAVSYKEMNPIKLIVFALIIVSYGLFLLS